MRAPRIGSVAVVLALGLAACTGAEGEQKDKDQPRIPLAAEPLSVVGEADGPALVPKMLVLSTDKVDSALGDVTDQYVDRRSGAFAHSTTAVAWTVDNLSGYDLKTGKQTWTAKLDLGTDTICSVTEPEKPVKQVTVVYGGRGGCLGLATVKTSTGEVVQNIDVSDYGFESGTEIGAIEHHLTVGATDYLIDLRGRAFTMRKGLPVAAGDLGRDGSPDGVIRTHDRSVVVTTVSSGGACRLEGHRLPTFEKLWSVSRQKIFPKLDDECLVRPFDGDGTWAVESTGYEYWVAQLDPQTGKVLGTTIEKQDARHPKGEFSLSYAALLRESSLGMPNGDLVATQVRGIARYSLADRKQRWHLDLSGFVVEDEDYGNTHVRPRAMTPDGKTIVATYTNTTTVEILAIDADKGTLLGRWPLPKEYRGGFELEPVLELYDEGIVLTRNFEAWDAEFGLGDDNPALTGDVYDIGVFAWPKPKKAD